MRKGFTLIEFLVAMILSTLLLAAAMGVFAVLLTSYNRTMDLLLGHGAASRFLQDARRDLGRAVKAEAEAGRLALTFGDGSTAVYEFKPDAQTLTRISPQSMWPYPESFESVGFRLEGPRAVVIDVKFRSADSLRWTTAVHCRSLP